MFDIEAFRNYCLAKAGVTESFPFDESTLVFKVMHKMFALADLHDPQLSFNLKCDPELAVELRARYAAVTPGYHMNKNHWNTVAVDGSIPKKEILGMIDDSYTLVIRSLTKKDRAALLALQEKRK